jgi:hypothetical protein
MSKKFRQLLLFVALLALLVPVALLAAEKGMMTQGMMTQGQGMMEQGQGMMPAADGMALMMHITRTDPYVKWDLLPGTTKLRQGKEPHGALQNVYVNKVGFKAFTEKSGSLPEGSIIVKENYMPDKKLGAVTVMYKKKGYNPAAGDIMWLKYGPDMKIMAQGKADPCIQCHAQFKDNDYVVLAPLKK